MLTTTAETRIPFERPLPSESADVQEIVRGILTVQRRYADAEHHRLERGTHAKGVCARATFEVLDFTSAVGDPRLAARLARGVFARPGTYPAIVRFANGSSQVRGDRKGDVRALSFSIDVPPGLLSGSATRLDFSMNDAPVFPINDAHAFATLMRVAAASGIRRKLKALWSLTLREMLGLARTAMLGAKQTRGPARPYQTRRYWSTVPFRHGGRDAIKYSAIPADSNPSQPLNGGPDCLRDELVRHLTDDTQMSSFDFALQFLDAGRMTHWGRRREPSYWVENASVEWKESETPFYTVGRLTLVPDSELGDDAARSMYIDVTQYSTPDSAPLGSVNRARWAAESASRQARMSGVAEIPPEIPLRRSLFTNALRVAVIAFALVFGANQVAGWYYHRGAAANVPPLEPISDFRYLDQGWGTTADSPERQLYYYTAQGASMHGIRYSWFINLERPFSTERFAEPNHMRQLRFIVDPLPTRANPDLLPIGFGRRFDDAVEDYVVDITCSACHTGQLNVKRPDGRLTAVRVDGGQAMHAISDADAGSFQAELLATFGTTLANPKKFNRFAKNVLGAGVGYVDEATLWRDMAGVFSRLIRVARGSGAQHWYPTQEGYGRTDALARIANTVFGDHINPANYRIGNAPVNFPYLWNIWKFDWVQYNASVSQPLARNVGEVMGTGATYRFLDDYGRPVPPEERYRTSIDFYSLQHIETTLQTLQPPPWPQDLFGPIDQAKATRGEALFNEHCVGCHGPHIATPAMVQAVSPGRGPGDPLWQIPWKPLDDIGTDPNTAMNFAKHRVDLTRSGLEADDVARMLRVELQEKDKRMTTLAATLRAQIAARTKARAPQSEINDLQYQLEYATSGITDTQQALSSLGDIDLRSVSIGEGLTIFGMTIRQRFYTDQYFAPQEKACFEGFDTLDLPQTIAGYKPRPLKGVWATPPFLHNGSVPTVYALLSPPPDKNRPNEKWERPETFYVGTREYDPLKMGYVTTRPSADAGGFVFDTRRPGNHNTGHVFSKAYKPWDESKPPETQYQNGIIGPELSHDDRMALIEYLKVGPAEPPAPAPHQVRDCFALLEADKPPLWNAR